MVEYYRGPYKEHGILRTWRFRLDGHSLQHPIEHLCRYAEKHLVPKENRYTLEEMEATWSQNPEISPNRSLKIREFLNNNKDSENFKSIILLSGEPGNGKTTTMYAMVLEFLENKPDGRVDIVRWFDLCQICSAAAGFNDQAMEYLDGYHNAELLAIDELGEAGTTTRLDAIQDLIKKRRERGRKTILNSNLDYEHTKQAIGDKIVSRIELVIKFEEDSYRTMEIV